MSHYNNHNYQNQQNNRNRNQRGYGDDMGRFNDFDMCKMMDEFDSPFDNMFSDFGFGGMGSIFGNAERMMQKMHEEMRMIGNMNDPNNRGIQLRSNSGNPGTFISKSYVSRVNYKDGKPQKEVYQSQAINQLGSDGRRIAERQEAYKNSNGLEKASHQRTLDGRGQKCIKQRNRNTGEQNEHNIYKDMQESDLENFNREYNDYRQKCGFQNNYRALGQMNNAMGRMIGNGRRNNQNAPLGLPSGNPDLQNFDNQPVTNEPNNNQPRWNTRRSRTNNINYNPHKYNH